MAHLPKIPALVTKNYVIGRDFDIMKRESVEISEQVQKKIEEKSQKFDIIFLFIQ
jgi:hypothetical protein